MTCCLNVMGAENLKTDKFTMGNVKKIVIAEDQTLVRQGLRSLLESEKKLKVVAEAGDGIEAIRLVEKGLPLPAYEMVMKASHTFNLLDARHAISVTERQRFILRVRTLSRAVAQSYFDARAKLGFPLASEALRQEVLGNLQTEAS